MFIERIPTVPRFGTHRIGGRPRKSASTVTAPTTGCCSTNTVGGPAYHFAALRKQEEEQTSALSEFET
jgi:hypothetical protein